MFSIKEDVNIYELLELDSRIIMILGHISIYCQENQMSAPVITSIKSDRKNVNAISRTHEEFRAIDIRIRDWNECQAQVITHWLNVKFADIGALKNNESRPALLKKNHIHIQVRPIQKLG